MFCKRPLSWCFIHYTWQVFFPAFCLFVLALEVSAVYARGENYVYLEGYPILSSLQWPSCYKKQFSSKKKVMQYTPSPILIVNFHFCQLSEYSFGWAKEAVWFPCVCKFTFCKLLTLACSELNNSVICYLI